MKPYIITLPEALGKGARLNFIEGEFLPFEVQRVFWIYGFKTETARGEHAHENSDQIIACINGTVNVSLEDRCGNKFCFALNDPAKVLYFPRQHWLRMQCSSDAIILAFASCTYEEDIYQKDYALFRGGE